VSHTRHMGKLITADEVAKLAGVSRSQVNRDAAAEPPKIKTELKLPGSKGARLFNERDARRYAEARS
jgi:hypothetical protein